MVNLRYASFCGFFDGFGGLTSTVPFAMLKSECEDRPEM